jgi:hypothetical protein
VELWQKSDYLTLVPKRSLGTRDSEGAGYFNRKIVPAGSGRVGSMLGFRS